MVGKVNVIYLFETENKPPFYSMDNIFGQSRANNVNCWKGKALLWLKPHLYSGVIFKTTLQPINVLLYIQKRTHKH